MLDCQSKTRERFRHASGFHLHIKTGLAMQLYFRTLMTYNRAPCWRTACLIWYATRGMLLRRVIADQQDARGCGNVLHQWRDDRRHEIGSERRRVKSNPLSGGGPGCSFPGRCE